MKKGDVIYKNLVKNRDSEFWLWEGEYFVDPKFYEEHKTIVHTIKEFSDRFVLMEDGTELPYHKLMKFKVQNTV